MSYDLNFLEACKALDEDKCTKIENEFGSQYAIDKTKTSINLLNSVCSIWLILW